MLALPLTILISATLKKEYTVPYPLPGFPLIAAALVGLKIASPLVERYVTHNGMLTSHHKRVCHHRLTCEIIGIATYYTQDGNAGSCDQVHKGS